MKELKDMSEVEIKAMSYENLVQIEQCQNNLKVLNQELVSRTKTKPEVPDANKK